MSKEKLEEIRKDNYPLWYFYFSSEVDTLMKLAYNKALEDANKKCGSILIDIYPNRTIGESILKLKIK